MNKTEWFDEFPYAITVSNLDGNIIDMNEVAAETFAKWGGKSLIGKSLMDCHNSKSVGIIEKMMHEQKANIYTIEKAGKKKLICQSPWYKDGVFSGLVEISIELPEKMENRIR